MTKRYAAVDEAEALEEESFAHRRTEVVSECETAECVCPEPCLRDHENE